MKKAFAETENYQRLLAAVARVESRAAREAGLLLVTSPAGYGKTNAVRRFAVQQDAIYLRAKTHWTPRIFLTELVTALGGHPRHVREHLFGQAIDLLSQDIPRTVVIDEAEHLARDLISLEAARDLSDTLENVVMLVGMDRLQTRIARFPQIFSRVAEAVEFQPATVEDVGTLARTLCEVPIAADLAERIQKESRGRVRLILNALGRVEAAAANNKLSHVTAADVPAGALVEEFTPRKTMRQ